MDSPKSIEEVRNKKVLVRDTGTGKWRKAIIIGGNSSQCQVRITATSQTTLRSWRKILLDDEKEKRPPWGLVDYLRALFKNT